jgi:hypothetical protein
MSTGKKPVDELEQALIADAGNPAAWEHVAVVGPSTSPRPAWYGKSKPQATSKADVSEDDVVLCETDRSGTAKNR